MKRSLIARSGLGSLLALAACLSLPSRALAQTAPATPPAATATANKEAAKDSAVQLSVFTVSEEKDIGYESMQTTSGMRTVQELKNVANSISIMNAQLMEDLAVIDLNEASKWFVTGEDNPDPALSNRMIFRGIVNNYALRNGWIWYSPMDSYATERVELLRGPNAFLYGEADLGGANNQVTKRGLFTRNITRVKLMFGDDAFGRTEIDLNRRFGNKVALRVAGVYSKNDSWIDHVRRDFQGAYAAVTYRPFRTTTISLMAEKARIDSVNAQGLFLDNYSFTNVTTLTNTAGYVFVPATGQSYRANTMRRSNGTGLTAVDSSIVPKTFQVAGPNSTYNNEYSSVTLEVEQHVGKNLHLQLSGNFYQQQIDQWNVAAARNIFRDLSPTLPNGTPNARFNELYTEYFRTRNINGNIVRDMRISAVYDLKTKWTNQQFVLNLQQHQDNPGQKKPKWGEYVDPSNPNFVGTINPAQTQAAFTANRTTFTNNRLIRRYYLKDGTDENLTGSLGPIPGVSNWFPDLSNSVPATGNIINRRFYTPSVGVGASGSYFKNHLYTLVGYRRDHFNMKTTVGAPQPIANTWVNQYIEGAFAPNPAFVQYKVDGANYGVVYRVNEAIGFAYNRAQSFRISVGEGADTYTPGKKQSIPTGEGQDLSARFSLFGGRLELNTVYYDNYQPNARFNPAPVIAVRDEISAIFPTTFNAAGQDYQTITTKGYELEIIANLTRNWRLMLNGATNKVVTEDRAPLLKSYQTEAKDLGRPTPLLDAFLLTIPEGVPNAGYTKTRANIFTRYTFSQGPVKGLYVGGGANWREPTFRGNAVVVQGGPVTALWSPSYYTATLLAGYQTKIFNRPTSFAVNVSNLFDKEYYLSATTTTGSWGAPRSWRMTMTTDF
ncbi:TonB-dependent siderophore receptor [Horticoccus sp. 23ND18S-11]|uniref:TonB-dependent siderophore receptor n=1 Tax=Horticoccus sp. 23ND18S-11 TaxID=3391832 RepID=UPI0039C9151D